MSRKFESRRTHGAFADLIGGRAKPREKRCATEGCGVRLTDNRKTYCGPCYDARLVVHNDRNRKIYAAKIKAAVKGD